MKRQFLSKKDVRSLARQVDDNIRAALDEAENVEMWEIDDKLTIYVLDGKPLFAKMRVRLVEGEEDRYVPLLTMFYLRKVNYPIVRVDDGAVPHILNGADVMRPGIKEFVGDFNRGDIVAVQDFKGRTIAVTVALFSRSEVEKMQKGKVLKNVHYLGDKISKLCSDIMKQQR